MTRKSNKAIIGTYQTTYKVKTMTNEHINFNAFVSCRKTRNKEEYTMTANLYFNSREEGKKLDKKTFIVKGEDFQKLELELINQVDAFIFSHPLTKGVAMSSLVLKNVSYRGFKVLSQITTWNLIRSKKV